MYMLNIEETLKQKKTNDVNDVEQVLPVQKKMKKPAPVRRTELNLASVSFLLTTVNGDK